jgi:hypothetical protein
MPVGTVPAIDHAQPYSLTGLPADKDAGETTGFMVIGNSGDQQVLFWTCAYVMKGRGARHWLVDDARAIGTMLIVTPRDQPPGMYDNDFVRRGLHFPEYLRPEDLHIETNETEASWEIGGRRFVWAPPVWKIEGTHAGVSADLTCRAIADPIWELGPFEQVTERNRAGYDVPIAASGSVSFGDTHYEIPDGVGQHQREVVGQGRDIVRELSGGSAHQVFVGDCFADDIRISFAHGGRHGADTCRLVVGDDVLSFSSKEPNQVVAIKPTAWWDDPRSGLRVPSNWVLVASSEAGAVELEISGRARGYWHYLQSTGIVVLMWMLSEADGVVRTKTTQRVIERARVGCRWGTSILAAHETFEGPQFEESD